MPASLFVRNVDMMVLMMRKRRTFINPFIFFFFDITDSIYHFLLK